MPNFKVTLSDGTTVTVEADQQPTEEQVVSALKDYGKPEQIGALKTAVEHGLSGLLPGAAFTAAFPLGAAAGAYVPHPVGRAIVGGVGGIATGAYAAYKANQAQKAALAATVPEFAKKFELELQAGEEQHPIAAIAGDVASMAPSAKMAPFKLATLPFRLGAGAAVGGALPVVTEGRMPTWKDVAAGAATGAIYGEGRFSPFKSSSTLRGTSPADPVQRMREQARTQRPADVSGLPPTPTEGEAGAAGGGENQPPVSPLPEGSRGGSRETQPELGQQRSTITDEEIARREREAIDAGEQLGSPVSHVDEFTGETPSGDPFARKRDMRFMVPTGEGVEVRRRNFRSWLETVPPERRSEAIKARVLEEHIHRHVSAEDAGKYWDSLTAAEKAIETRHYLGEWSRGKYLEKFGVGIEDAQMGHEAIRRRMQKLTTGTTSEIAEAALRERWTLKTIDALGDFIRNAREIAGTKASREGLGLLSKLDDNLAAARAAVAERGEQKPAAIQKAHADEAERLWGMSPEEFSAEMKPRKGGTTGAGYDFAEQVGEEGYDTLKQYEQRVADRHRELMDRARANPEEFQKLYGEINANAMKGQFFREGRQLIDAARDVANGMPPLEAGIKHGVGAQGMPYAGNRAGQLEAMAEKIKGQEAVPAAMQKKVKPDVLTEQMKLTAPVPGQEREAAFPQPKPVEVDAAARSVIAPAITAGEVPDFDAYLGQLQSKYGAGLTREKAFWPWVDSIQKQLLTMPGEQVRTLLSKLDLYNDVAQALKPNEKEPSLGRIPDAFGDESGFKLQGEWMAEYKPQGKRKPTGNFSPEQQRRLAALGAIYEELANRAGGKPKTERFRSTVGPEDLGSRMVVVQPAEPVPGAEGEFSQPELDSKRQFNRLTPDQAADPKLVGEAVTADARASGEKVSRTKGLLALRDKVNNREILVSAWRDGRRGPVVTNPLDPKGSSLKIDDNLLKRFEPTHVLTLREPTEDFRQVFDSPEKFSDWFGEEGIEGTTGVKSSIFAGGPETTGRPKWQFGRPEGLETRGEIQPPWAGPVAAVPETGIPPAKPAEPPITLARFSRRGTPPIPGAVPAPLTVAQPGAVRPPEILPPEAISQIQARAGAEEPYQPTPTAPPSAELAARGINIMPGARGVRPGGKTGWMASRPLPKGEKPAAMQKLTAAKNEAVDQFKIIAEGVKATVSRRSVKQDIPRLLDGAERSSKQYAAGAKQNIILSSEDTLDPALKGKAARQAKRELVAEGLQRRRAAIPFISAGTKAVRVTHPGSTQYRVGQEVLQSKFEQHNFQVTTHGGQAATASAPYWTAGNVNALVNFETKLQLAEPKAEAWVKSANPLKRRAGRAWLEAIKEMRGDIEYARQHWNDDRFRETAKAFQQEIHDTIAFENANGSSIEERDNYIPGLYEGAFWSDNLISFGSRRLLGGQYRMPKKFKNPYEAIVAGPYHLASRDIADLAEHRIGTGHRIVERGLWMNAMTGIRDPVTQQPIAKEPIYSKKTMTDPVSGNTWDKVIWKSPSPEYRLISPLPGAKPIAVRLGYEGTVRTSMSPSRLEDFPLGKEALAGTQILKHGVILLFDTFHPARLAQYMASLVGIREPIWNRAQRGYSALTYRESDIPRAVERGHISQASADWALKEIDVKLPDGTTAKRTRKQLADYLIRQGLNVSTSADALYKQAVEAIPIIGEPYHKIIGPYNKWLFDRFVPGMMLESAVRNFEKYNGSHPGAGIKNIAKDVIRDTNVYFGNMGRQGVFRSATFRDLAQLTLLAPMWQEGLIMKEAQFATRMAMLPARALGGSFRKGLPALGTTGSAVAAGLGAYFALSQLINLVTRGHLTFQNKEEGHKLDAWIPTGDGKGLWLSPLSVFAEVTHDFLRLGETKPRVWDRIVQMGENRLGPIGKMADILLTGKSPTGERYTTTAAQLKGAAAQITPFAGAVPITAGVPVRWALNKMFPTQVSPNPPGAVPRQIMASLGGVKTQASRTSLQQASHLAREFIEREGLKKDTGWQQVMTDEPGYSTLRQQIRNNDEAGARKTFEALRKTRSDADIIKGMRQWAKRPLTGSQKNERMFIYSLSDDELETYTRANQERQETLERFYNFMNSVP